VKRHSMMGLTKEEAEKQERWERLILRDVEGSFWEWDGDNRRYYILGLDGQIIWDSRSPGVSREEIDRLYGPTELVPPHTPLQQSISELHRDLRNAFIID
jgi:hypothetical protein